jgi:hypothetical protein
MIQNNTLKTNGNWIPMTLFLNCLLACLLVCLLACLLVLKIGKPRWRAALPLLSILWAPCVMAQTTVSGTLAANTTWQAANGPYVVTADLLIPANVTLSIEAGTQIYMGAGTSNTSTGGAIHANGTNLAPIQVQSDKLRINQTPAAGDWKRWILGTSSNASSFDHVVFEHGQGLEFNSSSATLNHCIIRKQLGAAITQNLAASLAGSGNSASDNGQNAVLIPAGDITGSARWALQGIPYWLPAGQVSVGVSPQITIMTPGNMQSGDSVTATVSGTRLSGTSSARFSGSGVTAQVLPGGSDTQVSLQLDASANASGDYTLTLQTNAGEVSKSGALAVTRPQPRIGSIAPVSIYLNRGASTITISGTNLANTSVAQLDDVALRTTWQSATQMQAVVPNQINPGIRSLTLRTPDAANPGSFLTSNPVPFTVNTPAMTLNPLTLSMVAGSNKTLQISLPFAAPPGGQAFSLASSNSLVASVPGTITVAEGQQSASFGVQGASVGNASIGISAIGWQNASLPVTVIEPPRALDLSPISAPPVGVLVGAASPGAPPLLLSPISAPRVGVLLGAGISQTNPKAGVVGSSVTLTLQGIGLADVTSVSLLPASGITMGTPAISSDGKQLSVSIGIDAAAVKGLRQLQVHTASGSVLFMNPVDAQFLIAAPIPEFDSVAPQILLAGQTSTVTVRGRNLRDVASVRFIPADGMLSSNITTNADATLLTASVQVDAAAVSGQRVLVVQTAAGDSVTEPLPTNTLQVARQLGAMLNAINAPLVGVQVGSNSTPVNLNLGPVQAAAVGVLVGDANPPAAARLVTPLSAPRVGVLVGANAIQMTPKAVVVGSQIRIDVQGTGLGSVISADFLPNTGLTVANMQINPEGTQLSLDLTVDANAAKTQRLLVLRTASGQVLFANPQEALLLVAAPAPTLISIAPQVVQAGQAATGMTVRGVNFRDVVGVRFSPPDGIAAVGQATANTDGTLLQLNVQADAAAASGPRTLIVMTAGGDSSADPVPANTFQVARQLGTSLQAINAPAVGVLVGSATTPTSQNQSAFARVKVVVGAVANTLMPAGAIKGSSGQWQIDGVGLGAYTGASVRLLGTGGTAAGVQVGDASANAEGTRLTVPFTVAANAPSGQYQLVLGSGSNTVLFVPALNNQFQVLDEPLIDSLAPTVLQAGRAYTLAVRGRNLQSVRSMTLEDANGPLSGVTFEANALAWSSDALGEKLTVRVVLDPATALGPVVLRLNHAAGASSNQASSANTINIVNP